MKANIKTAFLHSIIILLIAILLSAWKVMQLPHIVGNFMPVAYILGSAVGISILPLIASLVFRRIFPGYILLAIVFFLGYFHESRSTHRITTHPGNTSTELNQLRSRVIMLQNQVNTLTAEKNQLLQQSAMATYGAGETISFDGTTKREREHIQSACYLVGRNDGAAAYNRCLYHQITQLQNAPRLVE